MAANPTPRTTEPELVDYLRLLRRRKWTVIVAVLVVTGAAFVASLLQTPVYEARAELLLQARGSEGLFDPQTGERTDARRNVETEIQVLSSQPVKDAVRNELGAAPKVGAAPIGETDVVRVTARHSDPESAARIANAYSKAYIDFRRQQAVDDLLAAGEQLQRKITELQTQIGAVDRQLAAASARTDTAALSAQREELISQQGLFKQKLDQLQVDAALKRGGAQLVTPASTPKTPVEPTPVRTTATAGVIGLIFGTGLALLLEYLDDTLKSKEDIERTSGDIPVLGMVPALPAWKERDKPVVVSLTEPTSAAAEAYRTLRTSIQFMGLERAMKTLQVTSPNASEGKTTTLANLAIALARAGERVIVLCCDLRRPRIHEFFWLSNEVGFTSVLLGDVPLASALQQVPGEERLFLLASGPPPPNPSELLSSQRTVRVLTALQAEADIVLIDTPPVLPVTDAAVLSTRVDATLLVATAGSTTRKELHRAAELLRQVDAPIIGTVLNGVSGDRAYGYAYQYKYTSKSKPDAQASRRQRAFRR